MNIYRCTKITDEVVQAFQKLIPQLDPDCSIPSREYFNELILSDSSFLFLAEDEEITGSLTLIISQMPTGKKAWIEDVVVDKNNRGKGIGKKLIESAIEFAREKGISKIDLTSRPERVTANELYQKSGFKRRNTNVYRLKISAIH